MRQAIPLRRDEHVSWGTDAKGGNFLHCLPNVILTVSAAAKKSTILAAMAVSGYTARILRAPQPRLFETVCFVDDKDQARRSRSLASNSADVSFALKRVPESSGNGFRIFAPLEKIFSKHCQRATLQEHINHSSVGKRPKGIYTSALDRSAVAMAVTRPWASVVPSC